jgi:uncharacterized protein
LTAVTEDGYAVEVEIAASELQPKGAESLPLKQVAVVGSLQAIGEEYLFQGEISGRFVQACDRCLEDAETPFTVEVAWVFEEGPAVSEAETGATDDEDLDEDDTFEERRTFQGLEIDLAPHVWEEIALAEPVKHLCRVDCRGLCPRCGVNRNRETCACPVEDEPELPMNKGLVGLADLFPDLAPKRTEE